MHDIRNFICRMADGVKLDKRIAAQLVLALPGGENPLVWLQIEGLGKDPVDKDVVSQYVQAVLAEDPALAPALADDRTNGEFLQICAFFGLVQRNKAELEDMAPAGTVQPEDKSEEDKKAERAEQPYKALDTHFMIDTPLQERLAYEWTSKVSKDLEKHGAVTQELQLAKLGYQVAMRTQRHEVSDKMYYETQEAVEEKGAGRFAATTQKIMDIFLVILGLLAVEIKEGDAPPAERG